MRKIAFVILVALAFSISSGKAQTTATTYTIIASGSLANCAPVVSGQTQYCFPVDGLAISVKGSAYVLVPLSTPAAGIQSITVCNVAGTTCKPASTGPAITLNIPQSVSVGAPTVTSTSTVPTVILN